MAKYLRAIIYARILYDTLSCGGEVGSGERYHCEPRI